MKSFGLCSRANQDHTARTQGEYISHANLPRYSVRSWASSCVWVGGGVLTSLVSGSGAATSVVPVFYIARFSSASITSTGLAWSGPT
jgi:hypothetical protein